MRVVRIEASTKSRKYLREIAATNEYSVIYYSYDEFIEKVNEGKEVCSRLITTMEELKELVREYPDILKWDIAKTSSMNIWLLTKDTYVPDYYDYIDNKVVLLENYKGEFIPTTGCVIKLWKIKQKGLAQYSITSCNGNQSILLSQTGRLPITAAMMPRMSYVTGKLSNGQYKHYNERRRIIRIINKAKPEPVELKIIYNVLNPISPYYLKFDAAISKFLRVHSDDNKRLYLKSDKFRRIFMEQLKILMPDVAAAIKQAIPPKDIADYLKKAIEKSLKEETSEEVRNNIDYVIKLAYEASVMDNTRKVEDIIQPLPIATETPKAISKGTDGLVIDNFDGNYLNEFIDTEDDFEEDIEDLDEND